MAGRDWHWQLLLLLFPNVGSSVWLLFSSSQTLGRSPDIETWELAIGLNSSRTCRYKYSTDAMVFSLTLPEKSSSPHVCPPSKWYHRVNCHNPKLSVTTQPFRPCHMGKLPLKTLPSKHGLEDLIVDVESILNFFLNWNCTRMVWLELISPKTCLHARTCWGFVSQADVLSLEVAKPCMIQSCLPGPVGDSEIQN